MKNEIINAIDAPNKSFRLIRVAEEYEQGGGCTRRRRRNRRRTALSCLYLN